MTWLTVVPGASASGRLLVNWASGGRWSASEANSFSLIFTAALIFVARMRFMVRLLRPVAR